MLSRINNDKKRKEILMGDYGYSQIENLNDLIKTEVKSIFVVNRNEYHIKQKKT